MSRKALTKETFDLGAAISAWARDVSNEFIMGKSYDNLDKEDFDRDFTTMVTDSGRLWRANKHLPFLRVAFSLPWDFMIMVGDKGVRNVFSHLKVCFYFFYFLFIFSPLSPLFRWLPCTDKRRDRQRSKTQKPLSTLTSLPHLHHPTNSPLPPPPLPSPPLPPNPPTPPTRQQTQ